MLLPRSSSWWVMGWGKVLACFSGHYLYPLLSIYYISSKSGSRAGGAPGALAGCVITVTDCKAQVLLGLI